MCEHKLLSALVLGLTIAFTSNVALAQAPTPAEPAAPRPAMARLRQLIESIRAKLRPIAPDRISSVRERLRGAVARLEAYLNGSGQNGNDWREYLALENLKTAIEPGADVDPRVFILFQNKFNAKHVGLEERPFADVAKALRDYRYLVNVSTTATDAKALEQRIEPLIKLTTLAGPVSTDELYQASQALGLLEATDVAPEVVTAIREEFSRPNLLFYAKEDFVADGASRAIDRWSVDNSCKKKTFVHSHTHTVGSTRSDFVESPHQGLMKTIMRGTAFTSSTAHSGPAIVTARATTQLFGTLALTIDEFGVQAKCATACADTSICFTGFGSTKRGVVGRVVTRIASRQAPKQRAQNEHEANIKAAKTLAESLDKEAETQVAKLNQNYLDNIRLPLVRYNAFPRHFKISTTNDRLSLVAQNDSQFQLGAPNPPPAADPYNDMIGQMHETFFNNMMESVFSRREVTEDDINEYTNRFVPAEERKPPKPLVDENGEPEPKWSIVLTEQNPVTLEVDNNVVTLTIRGLAFKQDGKNSLVNRKIVARYTMTQENGRVIAKRDQELYVLPLDAKIGDNVGLAVAAINQLKKRLGEPIKRDETPEEKREREEKYPRVFRDFVLEPIELKEGFAKLGTLVIQQFSADDGWLTLGWRAEHPQHRPGRTAEPPKPVVAVQDGAQDNSAGGE